MNILSIDTSTEYLSIAVLRKERIAAKFHRKAAMAHSSLLVPMIDRTLKDAKLKIGDIDGFCVSIGPGSFTGLRIGVATIKGIAYSLKKPVVTVPTLDVIAHNARKFKGIICTVLDARKNKVYACIYKSDGNVIRKSSGYLLIPVKDLSAMFHVSRHYNTIFMGDGVKFLGYDVNEKKDWHPRAWVAVQIGLDKIKKRKFVKAEDLEPMYMYSKECDITGI